MRGVTVEFRGPAISDKRDSLAEVRAPRLCLIFASGARPDLAALEALAGAACAGLPQSSPFTISHRGQSNDWAELLVDGLTFDCTGLAAGPADPQPAAGPVVGLKSMPAGEVVSLAPGPHLAGGAGLVPVLRVLAGLGANLAHLPGVLATVWSPAGSWVQPDLFIRSVADWLQGGAFPALALTALKRESNGAMVSTGLSLLTGQELRFEPDKRLSAARMARLVVRLIHELVQSGPLAAERDFVGPEGEHLLAVPVLNATQVRVLVSDLGDGQ